MRVVREAVRLPRDVSGTELERGYGLSGMPVTRQRQEGSHLRLKNDWRGGHRITVPNHDSLRVSP